VVVDLCAGSGVLALAVADEVPGAQVVAVEKQPAALDWLRRNAGRAARVVSGDVTDPGLLDEMTGRVDAVLSNPPYVPEGSAVGAEVRYDPPEALFAGPDGLRLLPAVIGAAARLLRPSGVVAVEHHETHGAALPALLAADGRWCAIAD